jgi:hypothetical protein
VKRAEGTVERKGVHLHLSLPSEHSLCVYKTDKTEQNNNISRRYKQIDGSNVHVFIISDRALVAATQEWEINIAPKRNMYRQKPRI